MGTFPNLDKPLKISEDIDKAIFYYSTGCSQEKAAERAGISRSHLTKCLYHPDARALLDKYTVDTGLAVRTELLRAIKKVAEKKLEEALTGGDKSTFLDYTKAIRDMLAFDTPVEEKKEIKIVVE